MMLPTWYLNARRAEARRVVSNPAQHTSTHIATCWLFLRQHGGCDE